MAKYTFEFDTVTKVMECSVDGAPKPQPESVSFWRMNGNMYEMRVSLRERSEEDGVTVYTEVTAEELAEIADHVNL